MYDFASTTVYTVSYWTSTIDASSVALVASAGFVSPAVATISCSAFSPNGAYFASGGGDNQVLVWKTNFDDVNGDGEVLAAAPSSFDPRVSRAECTGG